MNGEAAREREDVETMARQRRDDVRKANESEK